MALHTIEPIAHMHTNLTGKFGLPRQAGVVPELTGVITFEPDYRCADALRGLEGFSHIWLLWGFSESAKEEHHGFYGDAPYAPTVRPPRLGGNLRRGVFATRSPFRPNPIALSCVRLAGVEQTKEHGTVLRIRGADLMDGTPILDIKPYIHLHQPCTTGWGFKPEQTIQLGRLAVETGTWGLFEIENGEFRVTYRPQERKPVVEYLSAQKRFRHLKEEQINEIQEFVDNQCEELGI